MLCWWCVLNPQTIFTIANVVFTIGTARLFIQVIKDRHQLSNFDLSGSVLTTLALTIMLIAYWSSIMYQAFLFMLPTFFFWGFVSVHVLRFNLSITKAEGD